ncbi:hypothetical protein ASPCADRAFT_505444, partial [Aspergillus carbonarius ITEM 5010]
YGARSSRNDIGFVRLTCRPGSVQAQFSSKSATCPIDASYFALGQGPVDHVYGPQLLNSSRPPRSHVSASCHGS